MLLVICNMMWLHSSDDMEMCSLKVLQPEGSPSRMLLRLMGERGCTTGHLIDYLQTLGNSEALQCLKPSGTIHWSFFSGQFIVNTIIYQPAIESMVASVSECETVWIQSESVEMCSLADPRSAPVCRSYVWPQPAPELLRCGQISSAVPVVQDQGWGELWPTLFTRKIWARTRPDLISPTASDMRSLWCAQKHIP